uniref:CARD domain-containing protein n=1 Tax=Chrysemys picta bellii TaxID=8478 RepID=A0A8C3FI26_CHRPI
MAANEKPSDIIRKARRKLTDVLQTDPEAVLSAVDAHLLITEREYFTLSQINDPQKLMVTLIETVLKKGELAHEQFLDCMENLQHTFPGLEPISEYLEDEPNTSSKKGNEAESPESDASSEKGNGAESPEVTTSSAKGNRAEIPEATASSGKGKESEILEASATSENRKGKGVKSPEVPLTSEKENSEGLFILNILEFNF